MIVRPKDESLLRVTALRIVKDRQGFFGIPQVAYSADFYCKALTEPKYLYETEEEFVGPVLEADGLIKGNEGPYGMEITEVDGEKAVYAENKAYWAVYEGEEYALQGIDTTPAVDGAIYKLVYTIG